MNTIKSEHTQEVRNQIRLAELKESSNELGVTGSKRELFETLGKNGPYDISECHKFTTKKEVISFDLIAGYIGEQRLCDLLDETEEKMLGLNQEQKEFLLKGLLAKIFDHFNLCSIYGILSFRIDHHWKATAQSAPGTMIHILKGDKICSRPLMKELSNILPDGSFTIKENGSIQRMTPLGINNLIDRMGYDKLFMTDEEISNLKQGVLNKLQENNISNRSELENRMSIESLRKKWFTKILRGKDGRGSGGHILPLRGLMEEYCRNTGENLEEYFTKF